MKGPLVPFNLAHVRPLVPSSEDDLVGSTAVVTDENVEGLRDGLSIKDDFLVSTA